MTFPRVSLLARSGNKTAGVFTLNVVVFEKVDFDKTRLGLSTLTPKIFQIGN
jgi:hypothetical protein